jgi:hypothetical protein
MCSVSGPSCRSFIIIIIIVVIVLFCFYNSSFNVPRLAAVMLVIIIDALLSNMGGGVANHLGEDMVDRVIEDVLLVRQVARHHHRHLQLSCG